MQEKGKQHNPALHNVTTNNTNNICVQEISTGMLTEKKLFSHILIFILVKIKINETSKR